MAQDALDLDTVATFGELLRHLRRRARLTQQELGTAVGYSYTHLVRLESRQHLPNVIIVRTLSFTTQPTNPYQAIGLPIQLTSFVGHEREMAEVRHLLGTTRLLTIMGRWSIQTLVHRKYPAVL